MKGLTAKSKKNLRVLKLFLISLIFVGVAASIGIIGCDYISNRNFKETFYSVSSLKVNNKIRVIQISDLHNCSYGKNNEKLISRVEKLKPDLILYTGDIVDLEIGAEAVALWESLADVAPSYYIYGNNEVELYYDNLLTEETLDRHFGFDNETRDPSKLLELTDELTEKLEAAGVQVLKNKKDTITIGTTPVDVYGVLTSNPSAFWSYGGTNFDDYIFNDENHLKITAIHEPFVFKEFTPDTWGDLVLAGHAHGGMVRVPMVGPLFLPGVGLLPEQNGHYAYGRYEVQGRPLIISAGLENKSIFRINNPPELVIVDINKF